MDSNSSNPRFSKPVNIYHEEVEEVVETITEQKEPVIEPKEVIEEKKTDLSKIRFNPKTKNVTEYKPKKKSLIKIALMGFSGQEMDASEQRKFDNVVVNDGRALLICIIFAVCAFLFVTNSDIGGEPYKEGAEKRRDFFNTFVNYVVDKYKKSNTYQTNTTNTVVLDSPSVETTTTITTPIIDTLVDDTRDATKRFEEEIGTVVETPKAEPVVIEESKPVVIEKPKSFNKDNLSRYYDSVLKSKHH